MARVRSRRRSRRGGFRARRRVSKRRGSRRRNPTGFVAIPRLLRRRRGRFVKTGRVIRHNPRRRRRSRRARHNPIFFTRRRRRGGSRRRRRSYARRNPFGRRRRMRLLSNPIEGIIQTFQDAFSMDALETLFHTGLGFGGTLAASRLLMRKVIPALGSTAIGRVGTTAGTSVLVSALLGLVTKNRTIAARSLTGGLLAALWQGLSEALPAEAKEFIPTLGDAETAAFTRAVQDEVLREMRGGSNGGMSVYLRPAGVSETYLRPAGSQAYLTQREAQHGGVSAYLTQNELRAAGVGAIQDEFSSDSMPERF